MHHLTELDAMRYCNWKEDGSPTSGAALEDSTEHGTYEFSDGDNAVTTNDDGEYQIAPNGDDFSIIHLSPIKTDASPLMMFGETDGEKQKKEAAEQQEEAGRRESEINATSQRPSSLAPRGTLSAAAPKENLNQGNFSLLSTASKISRTPSFVALLKAGVVATLLHLSNSWMPVAKAEIAIANTPKRTTSNRAPGYFDQAYLSFATSFCRHLEAIPTSLTLKITSVFSPQPLYTFNLAHWMQCDGLKNRALGQRFLALKKSSEDITHLASSGFSEYQKDKNPNHFDTNIKLMSDLQPRWKRLIQECEVNAMTTSNDFDHETLNMIQKEAKSYEDRLQRNLLQFKSAKSYYSYQTAKKLRPVPEDSQAEIIFFNKIIAASHETKKLFQDLINQLAKDSNGTPKDTAPSSLEKLELKLQAKDTIARIDADNLAFQYKILRAEEELALEKAWINPENTKKITIEILDTLWRNWSEAIQKSADSYDFSFKALQVFEKSISSSIIEEESRKAYATGLVAYHETSKDRWVPMLATHVRQLEAAMQQQKENEPDVPYTPKTYEYYLTDFERHLFTVTYDRDNNEIEVFSGPALPKDTSPKNEASSQIPVNAI